MLILILMLKLVMPYIGDDDFSHFHHQNCEITNIITNHDITIMLIHDYLMLFFDGI